MNETPDPRPPGDDELVQALGDALRETPDDLVIPPPVTDIAERAAAKARARNARRTVGSVAASVLLVAGGVVAWNSVNDGEPEQQELAVESGDEEAAEPAAEVASDAGDAEAMTSELAEVPARPFIDVDPAEYSTAPGLEWVEAVGPGDGSGSLSTLPDGRVMVRLWTPDGTGDRVFVTDDGATWDQVPMPAGVSANVVDLGEQLWIVTGWENGDFEFGEAIYVSTDQGSSWEPLDVPGLGAEADGYLVTRSYIGAAAAFGDQAVVATSSFTDVDFQQIAVDQGIAESREQVVGWGTSSDETGTTSIMIDVGNAPRDGIEGEPFQFETFEFTPEELGLSPDFEQVFRGQETDDFTIFVGDAAGLSPVVDFDGNPSRLLVAGGQLVLSGFDMTGPVLWTSPDAQTWTPVQAGDGFELAGDFGGVLWGGGWSPDGFVAERLVGGEIETVASFPGLSQNSLLSVGPSGMASTVYVEQGPFEEPIPTEGFEGETFEAESGEILPVGPIASKDGIELRFEADGTGVLIDTTTDEILREFSLEEVGGVEPPAGVIEIEEPTFALRIEDPETGEELVTFTAEDYADGFEPDAAVTTGSAIEGFEEVTEPAFDSEYVPPENWIAWSADGTDWSFERVVDTFGLAEGQDAWTQVAVGDGYVVAMLEAFNTPQVESFEDVIPDVTWFTAQTN